MSESTTVNEVSNNINAEQAITQEDTAKISKENEEVDNDEKNQMEDGNSMKESENEEEERSIETNEESDAVKNESLQEGIPMELEEEEEQDMKDTQEETIESGFDEDYVENGRAKRKLKQKLLAKSNKSSKALLKGHYNVHNNICIWSGEWGMSVNSEIQGITSEFQYVMKLPFVNNRDTSPYSGTYNGYFVMKLVPPKKVADSGLYLQFLPDGSMYKIEGKGRNKLGAFEMIGFYDPETKEMNCEKRYIPLDAMKKVVKMSSKSSKPKSHTRIRNSLEPVSANTTTYLRGNSIIASRLSREMRLCYKLLVKLMNHHFSGPFLHPVDPVALNIPDYFEVVKDPMDFSTIQQHILEKIVINREVFAAEVRRVFVNAMLYNNSETEVHQMAKTLRDLFEAEYTKMSGFVIASTADNDYSPSSITKRASYVTRSSPIPLPKMQRMSKIKPKNSKQSGVNLRPEQYEQMAAVIAELENQVDRMQKRIVLMKMKKEGDNLVDVRPMTAEEKRELSMEINSLDPTMLQGIVDLIAESGSMSSKSDEIEIDLDNLPNETLRKMEIYVKNCKEESAPKRHRKHYGGAYDDNSANSADNYD